MKLFRSKHAQKPSLLPLPDRAPLPASNTAKNLTGIDRCVNMGAWMALYVGFVHRN